MATQNSYQDIDVFIAGSGAIGATFAKKCIDAGLHVLMCEIGAADSFTSKPFKGDNTSTTHDATNSVRVPGYHKRNASEREKNSDRFMNVMKGALNTISNPTSNGTLGPASFQSRMGAHFVSTGKNSNPSAQVVTCGVGGMSTRWTCATPRFHSIERPKLDTDSQKDDKLWNELYSEAEKIIGTSTKEFDESIRHNLVLRTLQRRFAEKDRVFKPLPLACHRLEDPDCVEWHAADRILEELFTDPIKSAKFTLLTNHRCTKVLMKKGENGGNHTIIGAQVINLLPDGFHDDPSIGIQAKAYVIAAGALGTAQILANSQKVDGSNHDPIIKTPLTPNLARYIVEQPLAFCQVVLDKKLVESVDDNPFNLLWWSAKVADHVRSNPGDSIHIPKKDLEPQVTSPFTKEHPWHSQICRDPFFYPVTETIDTRLIVDLYFFGYVEPREQNRIKFEQLYYDVYGMPQPTFEFQTSDDDNTRSHAMMSDMCDIAAELGGYLPNSEPQFMEQGLSLHLAGTVRAGPTKKDHVADTNCKVYDFDNLYVGGNGVIPTGFGANPTLTSICYALRASEDIIKTLKPKH